MIIGICSHGFLIDGRSERYYSGIAQYYFCVFLRTRRHAMIVSIASRKCYTILSARSFASNASPLSSPTSPTPLYLPLHHPRQPISLFLHRKSLSGIFLDPPIPLPQPQRLIRRLQIRSEIRRLVFPEEHTDAVQLRPVAAGDGHFDLDRAARVRHGPRDAAREGGAEFAWGEELKG